MLRLRKYGHWYLLIGFALASFFIWRAVFRIEAHRALVFLHVFDVGQGDAIFIEAPNGNQALIDGGPDTTILSKLGKALPLWDRSLDLVILTHPHADHLDGLVEVLKRYEVGMVLQSGVNHSIPEYREWREIIQAEKIPVVIARSGQAIRVAENLKLDVLAPFISFEDTSPKNIHDAAIVLRFRHASSTALLMSDAESILEYRLVVAGGDLRTDMLKVGHHGSKTSTSELLLAAVKPRWAVISSGRKNRYGHPAQEILDRLNRFSIRAFRTDRDGDLIFMSDGRQFRRLVEPGGF